jgi:hypothetical protein
MLLLIAKCIIAYAVSSICWRILSRLVLKTDLHNVPGPDSDSFLKGERCVFRGDVECMVDPSKGGLSKVFATDAWDFHKELRQNCRSFILPCQCIRNSSISHVDGGVVRIDGVLGVWMCLLDGLGYATDVSVRVNTFMSPTRRPCNTY